MKHVKSFTEKTKLMGDKDVLVCYDCNSDFGFGLKLYSMLQEEGSYPAKMLTESCYLLDDALVPPQIKALRMKIEQDFKFHKIDNVGKDPGNNIVTIIFPSSEDKIEEIRLELSSE